MKNGEVAICVMQQLQLSSSYFRLDTAAKSGENCVFRALQTLANPRHFAPFFGERMWHDYRNLNTLKESRFLARFRHSLLPAPCRAIMVGGTVG